MFHQHIPDWGLPGGSRALVGPRNVCVLAADAGIRSPTREEGQKPRKRELSSLGKPREFHPGFLLPWKQRKEPTHLSGSGRKRGHLFPAQEGLRNKEETGVLPVGDLGVGWSVCA